MRTPKSPRRLPPEVPEGRQEEHLRILECCRRREAEAAAAEIDKHLCRTMNLVKAEIGEREKEEGVGEE